MDTRREFLKKAMLLSGAAGLSSVLPPAIQRALAINPSPGSTYLDAEHVVILMQENRSFDHCFGSLQGVRGFNDPRAFELANKNPVWLQSDEAGKTYAPFRLNIHETKATWMGDIPHSRSSQVDAYNLGKYDNWLASKRVGNKKYADIPLTLGYHTREDLPFNYALADAFTVCDQHFSSAMTSTWPNRMFMWTGTVREAQNPQARAHIRNDLQFGEALWKTFPERLEAQQIPWKIYQNDLTCGGGFKGEERSWLANFGCNILEYFARYNVKFSSRFVQSLQDQALLLPQELKALQEKMAATASGSKDLPKMQVELEKKQEVLKMVQADLQQWSREHFEKLPATAKNLHQKAFTNNAADPFYHQLTTVSHRDGDTDRELTVPKGDVFYQFREDVNTGKLPAVSWLAPPQNFSDHPSAPWYGSWYVSEVLDILTKNPETWKKTIFLLTYDENDGYFDHVPPFLPPDITQANAGKCSAGIDAAVEYISLEQELGFGINKKEARGGQIGLGFRVPMIVASPWSRGGRVCSEVFDHTSSLQFLEGFLHKKFGMAIKEDNISQWRRTVCGDLSSAFTAYQPDQQDAVKPLQRTPFIQKIYNAKFKQDPTGYKPLSAEEIIQIKKDPLASPYMPKQEAGIRPSCALPYQLYADGNLSADTKSFEIKFTAANELFGSRSVGSPFTVYAPGNFRPDAGKEAFGKMHTRQYAVAAGDSLSDAWGIAAFEDNQYHLRVSGPNGFFREYKGNAGDPRIAVTCAYEPEKRSRQRLSGNVLVQVVNLDPDRSHTLVLTDHGHTKNKPRKIVLKKGTNRKGEEIVIDLRQSFGWYDFSLRLEEAAGFEKRYAGRVETGLESFTDPVMGQLA